MRLHARLAFVPGLVCAVSIAAAGELRWISIFPGGTESALREEGASIWMRDPGFIIGAASDDATERLSVKGVTPIAEVPDLGQWIYLFHHRVELTPPQAPDATVFALGRETSLYLFPGDRRVDLPRMKPYGSFQAIPRTPLPPVVTHPADLAPQPAAPSAANPLVAQIVASTSQASWFQFVRDLSGDNPVTIGGQTWTISTRYSNAMFPTPQANAHATEYLEDRGAGWGYSGHRETYTATDSGCGSQGRPWQNLIFIVPGQVDYGTHQQVLFVNHYDSISFSDAESLAYAPGADDAISGGAALLEAMRLFKGYGFRNTIVFAWFSGEETAICGSTAYTRQHPVADMWRVVNMDQTAFDGDLNRLMDVYNWDAQNSPGSVALGDAFVQANADYGNIIPPGNIVRDQSHMCQTDHCPFWNAGVPAITLLEDLHNLDYCPCYDLSQSSTCHDSVTQIYNGRLMFTPDYSWPTEKAAIALIAHLADPLYTCPAAPVAAPTLTPGNDTITLSWGAAAGVTNYVVERAPSCGGPFDGIASVTGTTFQDTTVTNGVNTAYRIRTCPTQVSACVSGAAGGGPNVEYQEGSAAIAADSGDHDGIPDNCELSTVSLLLRNDGSAPLTNVRLASVASSNAAVRVASALPQLVGALGVGATASVSFKFYLGRDGTSAACGELLTFTLTATSDQSPPAVSSFTVTAERSAAPGPCDAQPDTCAALPPEVSPAGQPVAFKVGKSGTSLSLVFAESAGATSYNIYRGTIALLRQGIYDHAQAAGLCGISDGIHGDGSVTATVPGSSVPDGSYLLAVARNGAGESKYGTKSGGGEIPLALNACP